MGGTTHHLKVKFIVLTNWVIATITYIPCLQYTAIWFKIKAITNILSGDTSQWHTTVGSDCQLEMLKSQFLNKILFKSTVS